MTWFRVDDSLADHPKVVSLQEHKQWKGALALWTLAGAWCSKHLTDGVVPRAIVTRLGCSHAEAGALVQSGLWELDAEGAYRFHDWISRNPTREKVESEREATKKRVAEHRLKRVSNTVTGIVSNELSDAACTAVPTRPVPTRPDPTQTEGEVARRPTRRRAALSPAELSERIERLEARYNREMLRRLHGAFASNRGDGKLADSVWLAQLEAWADYPEPLVREVSKRFLGDDAKVAKGERYLVGMLRNAPRDMPATASGGSQEARSATDPGQVSGQEYKWHERARQALRTDLSEDDQRRVYEMSIPEAFAKHGWELPAWWHDGLTRNAQKRRQSVLGLAHG